jgi:hypothetical protein
MYVVAALLLPSTDRSERRAQLGREEPGLLPRREVAAFVELFDQLALSGDIPHQGGDLVGDRRDRFALDATRA